MNKINNLLLLVLFCIVSISAFAQKGARISGTISSDSEGPLIMVNVTERDKNNRIVEAAVTDFEGNFSMVVKNTANELEISYIGYKTQKIKIGTRTVFNIKMVEDNVLDDVVIEAQEIRKSGGLDILEREMTHATQKINMEEMQGLSFASVDEALQGQIAGLDVVMGSGSVGAGTQMRLRGISTLTDGDTNPLVVVNDNIFKMPEDEDMQNITEDRFAELLMINVEDIEEIEVLKDGPSCAIYGPEGANGVIKIKTKRGKRGPTRVNFSYKFKDKWTPKGFNILNGDDYTMLMKQALFNKDQKEISIPELNYDRTELKEEYENYNNNTDWVDAISKHGYRHEYTLNLSGGGERATFRVSGNYSKEDGQVLGQNMVQLGSSLALDYYVSERIKVVADFSFSYNENKWKGSSLIDAIRMMPNMSIYKQDENGNNTNEYYHIIKESSLRAHGANYDNPIAKGTLQESESKRYSINPYITLSYNLLGLEDDETSLRYEGMVNLNASSSSARSYYPSSLYPTADWYSDSNNKSTSSENKGVGFTTRHRFIFTPYLGNKDHFWQMNFQFELRTDASNSQSTSSKGLPTGNITNATISSELTASSGKNESRNISFTYDTQYSYKSKYMLRFSFRGEGITSLGDDHRWVIFPAISGRWNISDEPWMKWAKPVLSMLSIRPGYSIDGRVPSGQGLTYNTYTADGIGAYNGFGGYLVEKIRLTNLKVSDKREINIGSDFGFFSDKLTGSFNYYLRTEKDQLIGGYSIPSSTGFSSLTWKNLGSVRNTGWELNLRTAAFEIFKDFSVSMYFNVGNNYNEILEAGEEWLKDQNGTYSLQNSRYMPLVQLNNPKGGIYGFRYKGVYRYSYKNWEKALAEKAAGRNGTCPIVYDANGNVIYNADGTPKQMTVFYNREQEDAQYRFKGGDAIYEDINHDGTINQLDMVYLGNSNPKAQGGFGFTFRYKKFTLKANFNYRYGVDAINEARMQMENMATFNNQSVAVNYRWRKEGDITEIPRAVYSSDTRYNCNYLGSDRFVEDTSYLRLQFLQIAYDFDTNFIKKIGLRSLRVNASVDNLISWSKYTGLDPDVPWSTGGMAIDSRIDPPRPRSYTLSVSLGF